MASPSHPYTNPLKDGGCEGGRVATATPASAAREDLHPSGRSPSSRWQQPACRVCPLPAAPYVEQTRNQCRCVLARVRATAGVAIPRDPLRGRCLARGSTNAWLNQEGRAPLAPLKAARCPTWSWGNRTRGSKMVRWTDNFAIPAARGARIGQHHGHLTRARVRLGHYLLDLPGLSMLARSASSFSSLRFCSVSMRATNAAVRCTTRSRCRSSVMT